MDLRMKDLPMIKFYEAINETQELIRRAEEKGSPFAETLKSIKKCLLRGSQQEAIIKDLKCDLTYYKCTVDFNKDYIYELQQRIQKYEVVEELLITEKLEDYAERINWILEALKDSKSENENK